jgi:hypothetical protein
MKMDQAGRPADHGSCGPTVIDYNNDGWLDLFVAGLWAEYALPQRVQRHISQRSYGVESF